MGVLLWYSETENEIIFVFAIRYFVVQAPPFAHYALQDPTPSQRVLKVWNTDHDHWRYCFVQPIVSVWFWLQEVLCRTSIEVNCLGCLRLEKDLESSRSKLFYTDYYAPVVELLRSFQWRTMWPLWFCSEPLSTCWLWLWDSACIETGIDPAVKHTVTAGR